MSIAFVICTLMKTCTFILLNRSYYCNLSKAVNLLMFSRKELHCLVFKDTYFINNKHTTSAINKQNLVNLKKIQKCITLLTLLHLLLHLRILWSRCLKG